MQEDSSPFGAPHIPLPPGIFNQRLMDLRCKGACCAFFMVICDVEVKKQDVPTFNVRQHKMLHKRKLFVCVCSKSSTKSSTLQTSPSFFCSSKLFATYSAIKHYPSFLILHPWLQQLQQLWQHQHHRPKCGQQQNLYHHALTARMMTLT